MTKLTHKQKKTIARRLRTRKEEQSRVPIFQTEAWEYRKECKANHVQRIIDKANK